jgi:hypothetical protein
MACRDEENAGIKHGGAKQDPSLAARHSVGFRVRIKAEWNIT